MSHTRSARHIPRAGIDPIRCEADALAVLALAAPFGHDTIAVMLDEERRGHTIVVVTGTTDPDALFTVIDLCTTARSADGDGLILASSRPSGALLPDDTRRWADAVLRCEDAGLELVEWFVIGRRLVLPRERAGDPPRWSTR